MVGKKEYIQYFRMIPYIQPGDIRDAVDKESKKIRTPKLNVQNITPGTQPKTFKQIESDQLKALKEANKTAGDLGKATVMAFKSHISDNNLRIKESAENIATIGLAKVRATRAINQEKYINQNKAATHMTSELGRRVSFASDEKIRLETERAAIAVEKAFNLVTAAVSKDVQVTQNHTEALKDRLEIKKAYRKEREEEKKQTKAASSLKRQKDKELNKYNGMSLPGIANKYLSEEIQIALSKGLGKIFTGSQGEALTSSLGKSIIAGVSTAASGAILTAVAAGAAALVALMLAPFKLILSFSQKAFNFLKGIATQTETFKKLMELVMMPFMLMFTLLFAPVLMALAPLLATVIQSIASKQDAIMAVGAKIGLVIEKLFDDKMIETYIALIDQVVGAIDWFVDVVKDNLTFGDSIFETIVITFTKVMSAVLVEITRWAYGPEGTEVINELGTLIGKMIGMTAAFVISLLPAIFSSLQPQLEAIFDGIMQYISDLIIAGLVDTFGLDSGIVSTVKEVFSIIEDIIDAYMGYALRPITGYEGFMDKMAEVGESFDRIGDLIIAGLVDTFGIDSGILATIKAVFSMIGEVIGAYVGYTLRPITGQEEFKDRMADAGRSFDNLMRSITNHNDDNRVSNVDNSQFNFDISAGAGAGNLVDALTASLKLNGVI